MLLAFDIGGANLKAADGLGYAHSVEFPLWKQPEQLAAALAAMISVAPLCQRIVATMTGELADCYETKAAGVASIVAALQQAVGDRPTSIYLTDGRLVTPQEAVQSTQLAAASNWHALASYACRFSQTTDDRWSLLFDVGSTTVDLIPLRDRCPASLGHTDPERLLSGELVYTGVERSPLCAIAQAVEIAGQFRPLAQELFATSLDAYLLLGELPEDPARSDTADGRPRTLSAAYGRLSRAFCADKTEMTLEEATRVSEQIRSSQVKMIREALQRVVARHESPPSTVVLSGHGAFLANRVLAAQPWQARIVSLNEQLSPEVNRSAAAHALAVLARETQPPRTPVLCPTR